MTNGTEPQWTGWLRDYEAKGELSQAAFDEFLRYARALAIKRGEPGSYKAEGATAIGSEAVRSALSEVDKRNVDVTSSAEFRRILAVIVSRKVVSVRRARMAAKRNEDLEQKLREEDVTATGKSPLEQLIAAETAEEIITYLKSIAEGPLEREMVMLAVLAEYSTAAVRKILVKAYGEKATPSVRAIQLRLKALKRRCQVKLQEGWADDQVDG